MPVGYLECLREEHACYLYVTPDRYTITSHNSYTQIRAIQFATVYARHAAAIDNRVPTRLACVGTTQVQLLFGSVGDFESIS